LVFDLSFQLCFFQKERKQIKEAKAKKKKDGKEEQT